MHSKQTVKYICERYPSGQSYYYKQEIITHDSWDNIDSIAWSTPRPITKKTFEKRKKDQYRVEIRVKHKLPAEVIRIESYRSQS
ncbi:hypothetical protein [Alkalicoccobacillus murimartini]|uniref:Uncharacterized protein n=1 Tax=Alkalicoccobacillus murimartini TaxID=171685 RepID=A0ABT9YCR1_9BACI|nr:hypothetical protein [Alkalicoccobacillus murimartini]MDQ0205642.1 hypothetical protein [Alkalicoccobacillus murimartini]